MEETAEGGGGGGGGGAGQGLARNLGARAARQLLREGVRQDGKLLQPRRAAKDLSLGLGQLAPRRRAGSLALRFDRLTLPADSGVTAATAVASPEGLNWSRRRA